MPDLKTQITIITLDQLKTFIHSVPSSEKLPHLLFRLWEHFSPRRKGQFALLLVLMVLVSFAEVLSLGAIVPFLAALTNPKQVFELPIAQPFIQLAGIRSEGELLLPLTLLFGSTAIVAGAIAPAIPSIICPAMRIA